jgi:MFS family permease
MKPEHVQIMFVCSPLVIAVFSVFAKLLGDRIGRIQAILLIESSGALLLLVMALLHAQGNCHPMLMIPIYVVRTGFMNCTYALAESVLMDAVPSNERSRWKSLESVASFGWAGSALVGGVVSDSKGYAFAFAVTAIVQLVGVWIQAPLVGVVPVEKKH